MDPWLDARADFIRLATLRYGGDEARSAWLLDHPSAVMLIERAFVGTALRPMALAAVAPSLPPLDEAQIMVANIVIDYYQRHDA